MNIASPKCKKAILSCIYFFKRYEIITLTQPHYQTKTSLVHLAIDHDSDDASKMVALKFLRHRDHFLREVEVRSAGGFNDEFVINTLRIHDSDEDPVFREETISKGIVKFPYCLVMTVGERNLADVMVKEHIAGRDWAEIKVMMTQIACAAGSTPTHNIHSRNTPTHNKPSHNTPTRDTPNTLSRIATHRNPPFSWSSNPLSTRPICRLNPPSNAPQHTLNPPSNP